MVESTDVKLHWSPSDGGTLGYHDALKVGDKWVGHFYTDASDDIDASAVLGAMAIRYNAHGALVAALQNMVDAEDLTKDDYDQAHAALALARGDD